MNGRTSTSLVDMAVAERSKIEVGPPTMRAWLRTAVLAEISWLAALTVEAFWMFTTNSLKKCTSADDGVCNMSSYYLGRLHVLSR